ncbi:MAG: hypothetical protein AAFO83_03940 [Cyanobacteria bacterium J06607_13]
MVKASGQIEKDLKALQQRTQAMADALDLLYDGYLKALGEATKRQLMSAVYHLCTQSYPDRFVSLSWQQRNDLQKSLQVLAGTIYEQLVARRSQAKTMSRRPQRNTGLLFLHRLLESRSTSTVIQTSGESDEELIEKLAAIARSNATTETSADDRSEDSTPLPEDDWAEDVPPAEDDEDSSADGLENSAYQRAELSDMDYESIAFGSDEADYEAAEANDDDVDESDFDIDVPAADQRLTLSEEEDLLSALEGLARRSTEAEKAAETEEQPLAPVHLVKQQVLMEKAIQDVFRSVSDAVNELLQKAEVMPSFPKALMAAAADSRGLGEPVNSVPNVVKVSVRVMHGEANLSLDDDDDVLDEADDRRRSRRSERQSSSDRSARSRRTSRSAARRSDAEARYRRASGRGRSERSEGGDEGRQLSRRFVPHEVMEIEALPEFAVVNLQLSEIEFADPTVSVWRSRLRQELAKLKQLGVRYKKTQRSLETAQAEDAWRASWTSVDDD